MMNARSTKRVPDAPWLEEIPNDRNVKPLFTVLRETDDRNTGLKEENLLSLSYGRIVRKDIDTVEGLLPESFDTYQIVEAGDIVLRLTDLQNDQRSLRVGLVPERGIITSAYVNLRINGDHDPRFLFYQLHNADLRKVFYNLGGGVRQAMKYADLKWLPIVTPPQPNQVAIADFLDAELAAIDALIDEERALLARTFEAHEAFVTNEVTAGVFRQFTPGATSSVLKKFLPGSWTAASVRNLLMARRICVQDGNHGELHPTAADYVSEGIPFIMASDLRMGDVDIQSCKFITESLARTLRIGFARSRDVLMSHKGTLGATAIVPNDIPVPFLMLTPQVTYYRCLDSNILPRFLYHLLSSAFVRQQLEFLAAGQATRPYVGLIAQRNIVLLLPPKEQQERIIATLDAREAQTRTLTRKIERAIDLLVERKSATVSAAVRGCVRARKGDKEAAAVCQ